jgi:hypothetical protein
MKDRVEQLLIEFASRHLDVGVAQTPTRDLVLLTDDGRVVNVVEDTAAETLRASAHIGSVAPVDDAAGVPREWASNTRRIDGFEWSVACHIETGAMAVTSTVPRHIDAAAFDEWLRRFLDRVRASAGLFAA